MSIQIGQEVEVTRVGDTVKSHIRGIVEDRIFEDRKVKDTMKLITFTREDVEIPNASAYFRKSFVKEVTYGDPSFMGLNDTIPVTDYEFPIRRWREDYVGQTIHVCFADPLADQIMRIQDATIARLKDRIIELERLR